MFKLRFNQVFVLLLGLSFLSAFFIDSRHTDRFRSVGKLFSPVSSPAGWIGAKLRNRFDPPRSEDHRAADDVKAENAELRTQVVNLTGQLQELRRVTEELEAVGDVRPLCTRFRAIGGDPAANREALLIPAATGDNVERMMPVIYPLGIVGRIRRVGPLGAHVELVTDPEFSAAARFARIVEGKAVVLKTTQPFVVGISDGRMQIANVPLRETRGNVPDDPNAGIDVGDLVVLDDPDWPLALKHRTIGRIDSIGQQMSAPTMAIIKLRPLQTLTTLRDVMVMNKLSAGSSPAIEDMARTAKSKVSLR